MSDQIKNKFFFVDLGDFGDNGIAGKVMDKITVFLDSVYHSN